MNPLPSTIIESTHDSIQSELHWDADLFFVCSDFPTVAGTYTLRNIFDYCGDRYYRTNVYFCPLTYPPNEGLKGNAFSNLYLALQEAAKQSGYELHINTSDAKRKYLSCPRRRVYREPTNNKATGNLRESSSWNNNCQNTGSEILNVPKRRETKMPMAADDTCKLRFSIGVDAVGFFFRGGKRAMCRRHCGHPAIEYHNFPTKTKSLTAPDRSVIKDLSAANAGPAVNANELHDEQVYLSPAGSVFCNSMESQEIQPQEMPGDGTHEASMFSSALASNPSRIERLARMRTKFDELMLELEPHDDEMAFFEQLMDETLQLYRAVNGKKKRKRSENAAVGSARALLKRSR
jgi:hypothetical protein